MNSTFVNIGLHASYFAKLPALAEYEQLKALSSRGVYTSFSINIENALALLAQFPLSELHISVPTLGFTDPTMDYCLEPQFAVPISLRGAVAQNHDMHILPRLLACDIAGNEYPLLNGPLGTIDYNLIAENNNDNKALFTALNSLTYCYNHEQLINNQHLVATNKVLSNDIEFVLPKHASSFDIQIKVVNENEIISCETIHFQRPAQKFTPALLALWQEQRYRNKLHLHYKLTQPERSMALTRCCISYEIPYPVDVEFYHDNQLVPRQGAKTLQIKQYYGLSNETLKYLISSVVSIYLFQKNLIDSRNKKQKQSVFNNFNQNPEAKNILYKKLIDGVLDHSVPIYALAPYFATTEEIKINLEKINLNELDEHDGVVFEKLYQLLLENEQNISPLIEELDRLLSTPINETTFFVETKGRAFNVDELVITADATLETQSGERLNRTVSEKLHVLRKEKELSVVNTQSQPPKSKGAVYNINLRSLERANVIENFDWQANDKINLTDLIDALGESRGGSSVVHARINQKGDTEIWVEHHACDNQAQQYHIATLKGLKNLPGDLNKYIEVRH